MKVEVINTGSELLLGQVVNTHAGWLGRELFPLGLRIDRQVTVPDGPEIRTALVEALARAQLIIVTGGLGPTSDDITREIAAELMGRPLEHNQAILDDIHGKFRQRGSLPTLSVTREAQVPRGAVVLANAVGTAPGLVLEENGKIVVLLPGPPRELKPMWTAAFLPWLRKRVKIAPLHQRNWSIVGIGESRVAAMIEDEVRALGELEIGYCARPGEVDFRLISTDPGILDAASALVTAKFGDAIATTGGETLEQHVIRVATAKNLKIATAESCTGGLIGHRLTNVPGSSKVFEFGWITYSNAAKNADLDVPAEFFAPGGPGAVSEETARAMAEGARARSWAEIAVAVTGIAGPGGGTPEKPVGTAWFGLSSVHGTQAIKKTLSTDRETFKNMAAQTALDLLRRELHTFARIETPV